MSDDNDNDNRTDDQLGTNLFDDGFLRIGDARRVGGLDESPETENPGWLRSRWSELRRGRYPRVGRLFTALARCVPASLLTWAMCGMDDGSIWSSEAPRGGGPSDTCVIGVSRRREEDWQIGFRVMMAATPLSLLVALLVMLFAVIRLAPIAPAHDNSHKEYATPPSTKSGAVPAVLDSGRVIATTSTTTYVTDW